MSDGKTFFDVLEEPPQGTTPSRERKKAKGMTFQDVLGEPPRPRAVAAAPIPEGPPGSIFERFPVLGSALTVASRVERALNEPVEVAQQFYGEKFDALQRAQAEANTPPPGVVEAFPNLAPALAASKTFATGVPIEAAKLATETVVDPKNLPFLLSGAGGVRPALQRGGAALFAALQAAQAKEAVEQEDPARAALTTGLGILNLLGFRTRTPAQEAGGAERVLPAEQAAALRQEPAVQAQALQRQPEIVEQAQASLAARRGERMGRPAIPFGEEGLLESTRASKAVPPRVSQLEVGDTVPALISREELTSLDRRGLTVSQDGRVRAKLVGEEFPAIGEQAEALRSPSPNHDVVGIDADSGLPVLRKRAESQFQSLDAGQQPTAEAPATPLFAAARPGPSAPQEQAPRVSTARRDVRIERGQTTLGFQGSDTQVVTPSGKLPGRYKLVEADSLVASHDPLTFAKEPRYPAGIQERAYEQSKEAQQRVIEQAQNYNPNFTVNTNPDAVNGPPVVTPDGIVLGGNSRAMSTKRLYASRSGDVYRGFLEERAGQFGFSPEDVAQFKRPVLVREVEAPQSTEALRRIAADLNKSFTGALGVSERAVSAGKSLRPDTLESVGGMLDNLGESATMRDLLRERGRDVIGLLERDGVITPRERPQFVDTATGGLSEEGKTFVERALLGSVVDDPVLMDRTPKAVLSKLDRSLADLSALAGRTDEYNLLPVLREALSEHAEIVNRGTTVESYLGQSGLFGGERNPLVASLVRLLAARPTEVKTALREFTKDARFDVQGQGILGIINKPTPAKAFNSAFGTNLTSLEFAQHLRSLLDDVLERGRIGTNVEQQRTSATAVGDRGAVEGVQQQPAGEAFRSNAPSTGQPQAPKQTGSVGERGSLSFRPISPPATRRLAAIREAQERGPVRPSLPLRLREIFTTTKRRYYDQFVDVRNGVREMEKRGVKLEASENPDAILDIVYGGTGGKLQAEAIEFRRVMDAAQKAELREYVQDYMNLTGYRRAIRVIEERAAAETDRGLRAEYKRKLAEGGIVPQYKDVGEINADLAAMQKKLGAQRFAEVKSYADRIFARSRSAWDLAHRSGLISRPVYEQGLRRGPEYIPLERIIDDIQAERYASVPGLDLKQQRILQRFEGSERFNRNPFAASFDKILETIREAERNRAARTVINALLKDKDVFAKQVTRLKTGERLPSDSGRVAYYEGGEKVEYAVPKLWADALNLADTPSLEGIGSVVLGTVRSVFKTGATGANLAFALKNIPRDVQDVFLLSKAGARTPVDVGTFGKRWLANYKSILSKDNKYLSFLRSGAAFSTLQKQISPETFLRLEREGLLSKANVPGRVIDSLEALNNAAEESTKMTAWETLINRGVDPTEAAIEVRRYGGSPDFARRGQSRYSRPVDLAFMFFNAGLQGTARTFKRGFGVAVNPKTWAAATAATLALYAHNAQFVNDDGSRELDHVSETDRQNSWVILRPETYQTADGQIRHRYYRVPKPQGLRILFNAVEDVTDQIVTGNFKPIESTLKAAGDTLPGQFNIKRGEVLKTFGRGVVSSANPVIREPIEQLMGGGGTDIFRGIPIVPRRLQDLAPSEQKTPATSPTATALAERLNASPLRVEHAIRGTLAGLGDQGLALADTLSKKPRGRKILEGDQAVANIPVFGPLLRGFVGTAVDEVEKQKSDRFYRHLERATEARRTYTYLQRTDPDKAARYLRDPDVVVYAYLQPGLQKSAESLAQIRDAIRKVSDLENVPVEERRRVIRALNAERKRILDYGEQVDTLLARSQGKRKDSTRAGILGLLPVAQR